MNTINNTELRAWLEPIKKHIRQSQIKASLAINRELIALYWYLGKQIFLLQKQSNYGDGIIAQMAQNLKEEFPEMSGFSRSNLFTSKQFYLFYSQGNENVQQLAGHLHNSIEINKFEESDLFQCMVSIPWGHHALILRKIKEKDEAVFYIQKIIENNWSRSILEYQIEVQLFARQGKSINNFKSVLPLPQSDLAVQIFKDPYNFEFISLTEKSKEIELERKLIQHITHFLLELGKGFAYMGKQYQLKVGNKDYRTDLLFYHTRLKCYIIFELKFQEFQPEFIGKLNFYISAINELIKDSTDNQTIGILLCKNKDNFEVEFSLRDINKPIGVSEYRYVELPESIKQELPTEEQLQNELRNAESIE